LTSFLEELCDLLSELHIWPTSRCRFSENSSWITEIAVISVRTSKARLDERTNCDRQSSPTGLADHNSVRRSFTPQFKESLRRDVRIRSRIREISGFKPEKRKDEGGRVKDESKSPATLFP
jgi:hypothetical protein